MMSMLDLVETMNNKIHDGDDGMEVDGEKIYPGWHTLLSLNVKLGIMPSNM